MKHISLFAMVLLLASCGHPTHKTPMFFGLFGPMEWPEEHWQGQNYAPTVADHQNNLPAARDRKSAMLGDVAGLSPEEFVQNLKDADIIRRVYNEKAGVVESKETGTVIIEIAPNFYALSRADQDVIADLLARSYQKETYILKDTQTQKTVGQITPEGLDLF